METDPWALAKSALSACKPENLPKGATCRVFKSATCQDHGFYMQRKDDPCLFGARLVGSDGQVVPFNVLDLATKSIWFAAYLDNR